MQIEPVVAPVATATAAEILAQNCVGNLPETDKIEIDIDEIDLDSSASKSNLNILDSISWNLFI